MKLSKETLKKIILEEMQSIVAEADEEVGSFYKEPGGALFGRSHFGNPKYTGMQGLELALEDARDPILRIQRVAENCMHEAEYRGEDESRAPASEQYIYFQNMVKICDEILEKMQLEVLMQF